MNLETFDDDQLLEEEASAPERAVLRRLPPPPNGELPFWFTAPREGFTALASRETEKTRNRREVVYIRSTSWDM